MEPALRSDASLVELTLTGDREAFGEIVGRYQSPICALAYASCGSIAQSEDLAQEIFIAAWRNLRTLRDPARFKAWLYGIARNLIHNAFRREDRNPTATAETWEDSTAPGCPTEEPDERAISKEEETILWHVLSGLPAAYREAMVLYYRQHESVPDVSAALGISEEAVRQRLSRGRTLLEERVARVVQSGLQRTAPGDGFALAVVAGLPILAAATTAKGAIIGVAATKGATAPTTGLLAILKSAGIFLGIIAVPATLGTYFGHKLGKDAGGLPQLRKSAAKFWRIFGLGLVVLLFVPLLLTFTVPGFLREDARATFLRVVTVWLGLAYPFTIGAVSAWAFLRRRAVLHARSSAPSVADEAAATAPAGARPKVALRLSRRLVLLLTIAAVGLLAFCFSDMRHNVRGPSREELQNLVAHSAPGELTVHVMMSHPRSIWKTSPEWQRQILIDARKDGKRVSYSAPADDSIIALLGQKRIPYQTLREGRDFEILGAPGRYLPFLAAFVLGIGAVFLMRKGEAPTS